MGTSYVTIDGRSEAFNDTDLLVLLRLTTYSMRNQELLPEIAEAWEGAIQGHGPGVVNVPMDRLAGQSTEREQLSALLSGLQAEVQGFGGTVPVAYLRERCDLPGIRFDAPYPTKLLVAAIKRLRGLVDPERP